MRHLASMERSVGKVMEYNQITQCDIGLRRRRNLLWVPLTWIDCNPTMD